MNIKVYLVATGKEKKYQEALQEIPNAIESIKRLGANPLEDIIILETTLFDKYPPEMQQHIKKICEACLRDFGGSLLAAMLHYVGTKMEDKTSIKVLGEGLQIIDNRLFELAHG